MKSDHTDAKSQAPVASDTTELDLSHEGLTELPEWVGQLTQLRSLYLNDNQLTSLPEGLGQLTELRSLFLAGFGVHHAGMLRPDRGLMERLFADGLINVLVCTARWKT